MIQAVFLDSGPLGLITNPRKGAVTLACRQWVSDLQSSGVEVILPEIIDYEIRRELIRAGKVTGIAELDWLKGNLTYLPITTGAMLLAAGLWAQVRNSGTPTADPKELDCDVILAAKALHLGMADADFVVATTNIAHLSRFVPADLWQNIAP